MKRIHKLRRVIAAGITLVAIGVAMWQHEALWQVQPVPSVQAPLQVAAGDSSARAILAQIPIKGKAAKTGYARSQFGDGWATDKGCDMRNIILHRDLTSSVVNETCKVISGTLQDPYTGKQIAFARGPDTSDDVQIDHVVALSDAWQKGAQQLTLERRVQLANDPLELLAVDGAANQQKSDGDAATWLPSNKAFRCQYVARQIAVKAKYELWVTAAEHDVMRQILDTCPGQTIPKQ